MIYQENAPGSLSDAEFKSQCAKAGDWLWGTVQGSFNEKQTVNQIVVDAVIGMVPLVADMMVVRDIIAILTSMCDHPEERENVLEWVELVVVILALIPVLGGVIKGAGKLTIRALRVASQVPAHEVTGVLTKYADGTIQIMNRMGFGDAQEWFLNLRVMNYAADVQKEFNDLCDGFIHALVSIKTWPKWKLPYNVCARIDHLIAGLTLLRKIGERMIPEALKTFHDMLTIMQNYIRTGSVSRFQLIHAGDGVGKPKELLKIPSVKGNKPRKYGTASTITLVVAGQRNRSLAEEARLKQNLPPYMLPREGSKSTTHSRVYQSKAVEEIPEDEIILEHLYHDNTPLADAPFTLRLSNGQVIEGRLDALGQARIKVPPQVTGTVEYGHMPGQWKLADKTPNPDKGSVPSRIEGLLNKYVGACNVANQTPRISVIPPADSLVGQAVPARDWGQNNKTRHHLLPDKSLLLPNELEQQQIFHLLKRYSSWTAWNRIREYFKTFVDITEESVRRADNSGLLPKGRLESAQTSITYNDYIDITRAYALFDEGVRRLSKGDKRVFTYDEATGFFARAGVITEHYSTAKWKLDSEEIIWKASTPLMKEFFDALEELSDVRCECGCIVEPRDLDEPARVCYNLWYAVFLPKFSYPDLLPEIPKPKSSVFVRTGEEVPHSGIWEPVKDGTMERISAMNYLHGTTPAPQATLTYKDNSDREFGFYDEQKDVAWRLIWRDDRYEDGTVPEEEQNYRFDLPTTDEEPPFRTDASDYLQRHKLPHPFLDDSVEPSP